MRTRKELSKRLIELRELNELEQRIGEFGTKLKNINIEFTERSAKIATLIIKSVQRTRLI